ncbi:MAG: GDP-mannose 4,6-dehydratase [SAR324 cluster bacterium]|nr:GDP-mannose 4,6-dehydratase [SAR324 cluster bacterium]
MPTILGGSSLLQEKTVDFVASNGYKYSVPIGFDKSAGKQIFAVDAEYFRPTGVETLLGKPAKEKLGWAPKTTFDQKMVKWLPITLQTQKKNNC